MSGLARQAMVQAIAKKHRSIQFKILDKAGND
jgi:hypothetical protein